MFKTQFVSSVLDAKRHFYYLLGFTRDIANTNGFVGCSPCSCNNRSKTCNPETRVCSKCRLSVGDLCEKCEDGVDNATKCTSCLPEFWSSNIYKRGCQGLYYNQTNNPAIMVYFRYVRLALCQRKTNKKK